MLANVAVLIYSYKAALHLIIHGGVLLAAQQAHNFTVNRKTYY